MDLVCTPHHILTTRIEPRGFIKLLAHNHVVHIELSLRLRFYLRHSPRGYTVGTTMRFPIKIVEAYSHDLAAESRGSARSNI
jgi:hypothetical protein